MDLKIKLFLTQLCVSLINSIIKYLIKCKNCIEKTLKFINDLIKSIKFKYYLIGLKVLCFSLLTYSALLVTFDYLKYPYNYKLKVIHNINGFDLPDISLCTDSKVLFDRSKMYQLFHPDRDFGEFVKNNSVDAGVVVLCLCKCQGNKKPCGTKCRYFLFH